ncbi:MAG: hypothetical protein ABF746_08785 [Acetobacter orientalis]|uniref:hypothetical protein n=1 Tax=Acetobacter orientalis TaxID=146474 RepID=UPI0039EAD1ED
MARRLTFLMPVILLAACSSIPRRAQHDLIGLPKSALLACAGVPDRQALIEGGEVLEYRQDQQVQGPLTIKTPVNFELDIGGHGTCHMVVTLRSGLVAQIHYTGPSATLLGRYAACTPLVRSCEAEINKS